jgi:hypothetical protein
LYQLWSSKFHIIINVINIIICILTIIIIMLIKCINIKNRQKLKKIEKNLIARPKHLGGRTPPRAANT